MPCFYTCFIFVQEEQRSKLPRYQIPAAPAGMTIIQPPQMTAVRAHPPGGMVVEAPMVSTMAPGLVPGTLVSVSVPQAIVRPAMQVMSGPIMTAAVPVQAPLPIGGMRPAIGIPQGE